MTAEATFQEMRKRQPRKVNGGNSGPPTAASVNDRVDEMGRVFLALEKKVDAVNALVSGLIANDQDEMAAVIVKMNELEYQITAAPALTRQCTEELAAMRIKIANAADELSDVEAQLYLNITSELDDDNSPAYTNEASRKNALVLAKRHNDEYRDAKTTLDKLELEQAKLKAQLAEIGGADKSARTVYRGLIAQVENITARMKF